MIYYYYNTTTFQNKVTVLQQPANRSSQTPTIEIYDSVEIGQQYLHTNVSEKKLS